MYQDDNLKNNIVGNIMIMYRLLLIIITEQPQLNGKLRRIVIIHDIYQCF
jgi:hypothetical protein